MKYVITESQKQLIFDKIYNYIDNLLSHSMIVNFFDDHEDVNFPENIKHIDSIAFYNDDYDRQLTIYLGNYWNPHTFDGREKIKQSPILSFEETNIKHQLDGMFGNHWREPFLKWFYFHYGHELPDGIKIKTIE